MNSCFLDNKFFLLGVFDYSIQPMFAHQSAANILCATSMALHKCGWVIERAENLCVLCGLCEKSSLKL
jgi:hypothetical protein